MRLSEILDFISDITMVYCTSPLGETLTYYDGRNSIEPEYMDYNVIRIEPVNNEMVEIIIEK